LCIGIDAFVLNSNRKSRAVAYSTNLNKSDGAVSIAGNDNGSNNKHRDGSDPELRRAVVWA